jgi:hypothetical protein
LVRSRSAGEILRVEAIVACIEPGVRKECMVRAGPDDSSAFEEKEVDAEALE